MESVNPMNAILKIVPMNSISQSESPASTGHDEHASLSTEPRYRVNQMVLETALLASLAACGGSGGGAVQGPIASPTPSTPAAPSAPSSPTVPVSPSVAPIAPATVADAGRFLAQATLGFNRTELTALASTKYSDWIDMQFSAARTQGHYDWLIANGYGSSVYINNSSGLDNTIWRKLVASADPLRQRMVLALSELCVVSVLGINAQWRQFAVAAYLDILETNAFGNYRTLLQAISLSPAMGYFLTYRGNVKANPATGSEPDENYARELMQLFTIGLLRLNTDGSTQTNASGAPIESYAQSDVSGLARVFTGWNVNVSGLTTPYPPDYLQRPLVSVAANYETGSKSFLGTTIPTGTNASDSLTMALDAIFNHPNLPTFVSKQLIQHLVTSNPSPAYISRVSSAFTNNGAGVRGDMQVVIKAILLDFEARDPATAAGAAFGKLREPVVRFLNWARAFSAKSPSGSWSVGDLSDPATRLGQSPLRSGSVFNFFRPGYVPPNTALSAQGLTGPEFQITNESSVAGYINYMQRVISGVGAGDLAADYGSLLPLAGNSVSLLTEINQVLAASQLSVTTLNNLQAALDTIPASTTAGALNRIYAALTLVMASPEYIAQK